MATITKAQLKKIWATARQVSMNEEEVRTLACRVSGSESISGLSKEQASELIDNMLYSHSIYIHRRGMATSKQIQFIHYLEKKLGWEENPQRLEGFIKRVAKVDNINWLTISGASNVINGLNGMIKHSEAKKVAKS